MNFPKNANLKIAIFETFVAWQNLRFELIFIFFFSLFYQALWGKIYYLLKRSISKVKTEHVRGKNYTIKFKL